MANPTMTIQLKPEIVESVKKSLPIKNKLQYDLNISYLTLQRWLKDNSENLTKALALKIIGEGLNKSNEELLIEA